VAISGNNATIRLILTGARQMIAGLEATSAAVTQLDERVAMLGRTEKRTGERSFLMNQALFTMRRYAYMGTLAFTGFAAVAVKWGYDFNSAMQSATAALLPVMHSTTAVKNELYDLFNIAKYSPFQFKDLTIAFRSMYLAMQPLGISAKDVTTTIQSLVDALSATGRTSPSQLNRVAVALQHMAFQGRLTGFTVNQLARDGIPIFGALSKELGITGDQLHNISKLGIPAQTVLDAINKYIETTPGFMNAARIQARTLHGELTTLRDNISETMGALTIGSFKRATHGLLPGINDVFNTIHKQIKAQGGRITLDQVLGDFGKAYPWLRGVWSILKLIVDVVRDLSVFLVAFAKGLGIIAYVLSYTLIPVLDQFAKFIRWGMKNIPGFSYILAYMTTVWAGAFLVSAYRSGVILKELKSLFKAVEFATSSLATSIKLLAGAFRLLNPLLWQNFYALVRLKAIGAYQLLFKGYIEGATVASYSTRSFYGRLLQVRVFILSKFIPSIRAASAALWSLLIDNPIGLIVTAIVLLVAGLVILYFKWKWFHDLVNRTAKWIWKNWWQLRAFVQEMKDLWKYAQKAWPYILDTLKQIWTLVRPIFQFMERHAKLFMSIIFPVFTLWYYEIKLVIWGIKGIIWGIETMISGIKRLVHWIGKIHIPGWLKHLVSFGAFLGTGGLVGSVPNLGFATAGAAAGGGAIPVKSANQFQRSVQSGPTVRQEHGFNMTVHTHVHVDGKKVAESTSKHRQNKVARR
jgi:tape measure domain-containing protein